MNYLKVLGSSGNKSKIRGTTSFQISKDILVDAGNIINSLDEESYKINHIFLTHAHLDHIGALKHILPPLWMPTIFGTKLTIWIIKKWLEEARILSYATFVEVSWDSTEKVKIGTWFNVEFFRVNHSIPDCVWVNIETPG